MGLTSRKRRPLNRTIPHLHDTNLVIIASEGEQTEKQYFENIFGIRSRRVQIRVLESQAGKSAPKHVLARLKNYARDIPLIKNDQLWLVIDKDRWPDAQLHQVAQQCWRCSFRLAVSRPCFEIWLLLHFADLTPDMANASSRDVKNRLRTELGTYNSSHLEIERYLFTYHEATRRAIELDTNPDSTWPEQSGTRVYKLVQAIEALMNPSGRD